MLDSPLQVIRECCVTIAFLAQELQYKVSVINRHTIDFIIFLQDRDFSSSSSSLPDKPCPAWSQGRASSIFTLSSCDFYRLCPTVGLSAYALYSSIHTVLSKYIFLIHSLIDFFFSDSCQLSAGLCQANPA